MSDIRIKKLNNATLKIDCDMSIAMELSEAFCFLTPGYKFAPKFKMGLWDGKIRLFNLGSRTIGSGLFTKVQEFAKQRDYELELIQSDEFSVPGYKTPDVDMESIREYMESLKLSARGEPLEIREYQVNGVYTAIRERQCILLAATGSGKSAILYTISRYITEELNGRVLVIVPTVGLTTQLRSDFIDYSSHNGYDVESNFHMISAGVDKNINKKIVCSTFQSLKGIPASWLNEFTAIITDEGHKIQSNSFKEIYEKAGLVDFRLACTGTLHDTKCDLLQMQALTGAIHEIALAKDLIAAGQLVPLKIKAISLNYDVDTCKAFTKVKYDEELNWLITNPKRNKFITKLATNCKGTTLILFRFAVQGLELKRLIEEAVGDTRAVYYVDGTVSKEDRERIRLISNDSDPILIFSYGTSSAGINLPAIENIIIGHPIKSKISYLQSIGRGLRLKFGKTHCNLFDIGDNLTWRKKANTTYNHFGERLKLVTTEGYEFVIHNIVF